MNSSGLLGTHAGFMFRDRPNERSFIERCYAPLVPGCDERLFDPLGGLLVVEVGESDGIDTAVRLEDGRYTLVSREMMPPDWHNTGPVCVTRTDNPAVAFALWNGNALPIPLRKARSGRQCWEVPGIGIIRMYYNEKKEDFNYEPDTLVIADVQDFFGRFSGYPIVLDPTQAKVFSLKEFIVANRLYQLGNARGQFARHFIGDIAKLGIDGAALRWNRAIDPVEVMKRLPLLAWDLHRPIRVVHRDQNGDLAWTRTIYGDPIAK